MSSVNTSGLSAPLPLKKITLRVHPLTWGHLCAQTYLALSVRQARKGASISAVVAPVLDDWAAGKLDSLPPWAEVFDAMPESPRKVQVMACVKPATLAALMAEVSARLKAGDKGDEGEEPSLAGVAGEVVDRWFFSDLGALPYRLSDAIRKRRQNKARAQQAQRAELDGGQGAR